MRCTEAEFLISVRIDGEEIPTAKGGALDRHLLECGACRGLLSRESERSALLARSLRRPAGGETFLAGRILARATASPSAGARSSWRGFWLPVSVLAPLSAALLALAAGGGWWPFGST